MAQEKWRLDLWARTFVPHTERHSGTAIDLSRTVNDRHDQNAYRRLVKFLFKPPR